jgi:hypothetical protein
VGQLITLLGTWIQSVALSWLVYRLTHSAFLLGLVTFASQAPIFFITPFAGTIAMYSLPGGYLGVCPVIPGGQSFGCFPRSGCGSAGHSPRRYAAGSPARRSFTVEMVGREEVRCHRFTCDDDKLHVRSESPSAA